MPVNKTKNPNVIAALITAVWFAIAFVLIGRHEIWLDEAQQWLLAKHSNSLGELYHNMRYEGHPPLWNVLLYFLSQVSDSPAVMQYVHLVFAGGTVFLIARYGPFPLWARILLPFTYLLGYEYAIIARNYAPAIFFIVLACVWSTDVKRNFQRICVVLGVAACFHIYAGVIAVVMLVRFLYEQWNEGVKLRTLLFPIATFSLFALVVLWFHLHVPSDHFFYAYHHHYFSMNRIGTVLLLPFTALLHFPECTGSHWWNTNAFLPDSDIVKGIIALLFWIVPALVFLKNRSLLLLYVGGTLLVSIGLLLTPMPVSVRHAGFVAVLFLVCLWLGGATLWQTKISRSILSVFLAVQVCSWLFTAWKEYSQPFSESKNAAAFINEKYPTTAVAAYPIFMGPAVCLYLERDLFYSEAHVHGTFADWGLEVVDHLGPEDMIAQCRAYMAREKMDSMVIVVPVENDYNPIDSSDVPLRAVFEGAAVRAENYKVYILRRE